MVEETKGPKPSDARPKYEPPMVLRMSGGRANAICFSGSGDVGDCAGNGNIAVMDCDADGTAAIGACVGAGVVGVAP